MFVFLVMQDRIPIQLAPPVNLFVFLAVMGLTLQMLDHLHASHVKLESILLLLELFPRIPLFVFLVMQDHIRIQLEPLVNLVVFLAAVERTPLLVELLSAHHVHLVLTLPSLELFHSPLVSIAALVVML